MNILNPGSVSVDEDMCKHVASNLSLHILSEKATKGVLHQKEAGNQQRKAWGTGSREISKENNKRWRGEVGRQTSSGKLHSQDTLRV